MTKLERTFNVEFRAFDDATKEESVVGTAAVFNQETDLGWFKEIIKPGAFDECDMSDVVLNMNHDDSILLAGTRNGSMRLWVDDSGLHHESNVIDTTQGKDALKLVRSGLISKMSFAFVIDHDGETWETLTDGTELRTITKIKKLFDVSLVTFPAYSQTSVFARSGATGDDQLAKDRLQEKERRTEQDKRMKEILGNGN